MAAQDAVRPLRREIRLLVGALIAFLVTLIVALFALAVSILRLDRLASTADAASQAIAPIANKASREDLVARIELLERENGVTRVEIYRGEDLFAAAGPVVPSAEVLTRGIPGGRILMYFDVSGWVGGRRTSLVVGALATVATVAGLLLLILYLPKFVRPLEEILAHATQLGVRPQGDDDARYLVHTFREAVERIQQQSQEIDHLRDAASSRTPDVRELARALNRSFNSGFLALDSEANVVAINEAGRKVLALDEGEPSEPFPLSALPSAFASTLRESFDGRIGITRREVLVESSGALAGVTTVPLFEGEAFLGLFALFTDLTTFRAMEGRLRDLENLIGLGQMSAGIAHEFRNSLFTILGYLRLAKNGANEQTSQKIASAESEAQRLAGAVDALLNFARPLTIRAQRLRIDEVVGAAVDRFAEEATDVHFSRAIDHPVEINGDRELLDRAIENVLRNAIDAVRQQHPAGGGRIEVLVTSDPHVKVVVHDNGIGVDPESAPAFLLPFQSGKAHGFGLGLPLARKIALHHGGSLSLTGVPGEGATVTIEFFT